MRNENNFQELMVAIRNGDVTPERSGMYWSDEEQEDLIQYFSSGMGISEIALRLQRTEVAVFQRLLVDRCLTSPETTRSKKERKPECLCPSCELDKSQCCNAGCNMREDMDA